MITQADTERFHREYLRLHPLDWMHDQVKAQMREHPPGECLICDEKRNRHTRADGPTPESIDESK